MEIAERVAARRRDLEDVADAMFDSAWEGVRELALPFKYELDPLRAPSGRWRDLFAATPYRPLDLPLLMLEELGAPDGEARDRLERNLMEAAALSAAAVLAAELVLGAEATYGHEHTLLVSGLIAAAEWRLAEGAPDLRALRERSLQHWNEHHDALLTLRRHRIGRATPFSPEEVARLGRRWAPLKTPVVCAAMHAGGEALLPTLLPLLEEAAALFQLGRELAGISRDVARGELTYPVAQLWRALGGPLPLERPVEPERVLLAGVLTRAIPVLAEEALARAAALFDGIERIEGPRGRGLPLVRRALAPLAEPFEVARARYAGVPEPTPPERASFVVSHRPQREQVLAAAAAYVRADPSYREAWEVNRWGFLNVPELTCRVFPTGLILENRLEAGDDCAAEVDGLFERYAQNRFHYFEQPSALPPDTDLLGLMLRIADRAATPARARALLETPLGWLASNVDEGGELPVFLAVGVDAGDGRRYLPMHGRRCVAVQAGLLWGLLAFDADRFGALVTRAADRLFEAVFRGGAGCFWFYDVPYSAAMVLALAQVVRKVGTTTSLAGVAAAEARCVALIGAQRGLGRLSCHDAALLWIATRAAPARALRDPAWIEQLVRGQRQDGAWDAAPFYTVPIRGNLISWYASRLVTSSYCYRALRDAAREEA